MGMWLQGEKLVYPTTQDPVWRNGTDTAAKSCPATGGVLAVIVALHLVLGQFKLSKGRHLSGFLSRVPGTQQKHAPQANTVQYFQE